MSFLVGMGGSRTVGSRTAGLVGSVELVGFMVVGWVVVFWVVEVGWISVSMEASRVVWSGSGSSSSCFTGVGVVVVGREGWSGSELEEVGLGGSADMVAVNQRLRVTSTLRGRREMKCGSRVKMDAKSRRGRSIRCWAFSELAAVLGNRDECVDGLRLRE